eukprot:SAG11_NODE_23814_length_382_cov_4.742049_1_plen_67_part_10
MLSANSESKSDQNVVKHGRYRAYSDPKPGITHAATKLDRFADPDLPGTAKNRTINGAAAHVQNRYSE